MPKIVFIAHPFGDDVKGNTKRAAEICKRVHTTEVLPVAPYLESIHYLNDRDPAERELGMALDREFFIRKMVDELWLCGPRISEGMREEIELSIKYNIPIKCYNPELKTELDAILKELNGVSR